jgi:hypothetical protein
MSPNVALDLMEGAERLLGASVERLLLGDGCALR